MKTKLLPLFLTCVCATLARADFDPVTLTANSYTFDIVVESNTVQALPYCINVTSGNGTALGDFSYFEQGLYARAGQTGGNYGIPLHNTSFTNINNASMAFLMPPDYSTNNTLMLDSTFTTGTLTFNANTTATNLAILGTGGGGATTVNYTLTHADTTTESGSISFPDWFSGGATVAWGANARVTSGGGYQVVNASSVNNGAPYLYANTITVSGASPISRIAFTFSSGAHANIFSVSGKNTGASTWSAIPLGGFNVRGVVPAAFPLTATMDQGTNTSNNGNLATWFEKGYVTDTVAHATCGLPPSGSIFNSITQPTHHFQMGNYSSNNGVLIDANHLVANITPAVTTNLFSTFALLTAGGNVGGANVMTNICVLQHADGVNETNLFYAYDWFFTNSSVAWCANGRVNMYSRTVNNLNNVSPKLFETFFPLSDPGSPVTNIVVMYKTAPGGNSTTFIMAVSASAGGIPPVISAGPTPAVQGWYPTQTATIGVQVSGTAPVTNSWLVMSNGVYVPLSNGLDANGSTISGSGTVNLTISGLTQADATNYLFIAANAFGSVTSAPALVEIKGQAGVVPISGWNNIANTTFPLGGSTNIYSTNGATTATLTITDGGSTNGFTSGITGDGANYSLMHGYMDTGKTIPGYDGIATISGLTDASYDVYIYCLGDISRPDSATAGLPNYTINGTTYYAPTLGGSGASTYNATTNAVGGNGFHGFVQATLFPTNDFNQDISVSSFGNYFKITGVAAVGGVITVQAGGDTNTIRSPLSGIELVSTSGGAQVFGINFLGNTTDLVAPGQPVGPVINSQTPVAGSVINILTNHVYTTAFSVAVDASSATPLYYQWYNGATPIPNATAASFVNTNTNNASIYCIVSNFVSTATSSPVAVNIYLKPAPTAYQSAIFAYNPVAYWPLTETNGTIAFDYAGTNDGVYTGACTLGQPGLPPTVGIGPNLSAGFDGSTAYVDVPLGNLNITTAMTVIQWVQPPSGGDTGFTTTIGHSDSSYRLDVVGGQAHFADAGPDIISPLLINDGSWHQLVGVYDGTNQYLYVDGQLSGTPHTGAPTGSTGHLRIGGAPDYGNRFFAGNLAQTAIIPSALNASQVSATYNSMGLPPTVSITPANPTIYAGSSVTLTANLGGSKPINVRWYSIDTLNNSNAIPNATNLTYTIANASISLNGYTYGAIATSAYGTNTASTMLSVQNGPAAMGTDISPLNGEAYVGAPVTYTVTAQGSLPIYYQWLVDGTPMNGATNASYTAPAGCGSHTYQVSFTNDQNNAVPVLSSVATLQADAYPTNITFTNGAGWQLNVIGASSVPTLSGNVLTLTDGTGNESASAFYSVPQYVGSFTASFTYQGVGGADGVAFILQNSAAGVGATGSTGSGLGYSGISNSIALEFNLYTGNGENVGIVAGTNGNTFNSGGGAQYQSTAPVNIASGNPIKVKLDFANGVLAVSLKDTVTLATYATNYVYGPLTQFLNGSDLAYVGFSGSDGGVTSTQTISDFEFNSVIPPVALSVSPVTGGSFFVSWPATDPSYVLQTNSSLSTLSWGTGPTPVLVGGTYRVIVSVNGSGQHFYRLIRVVCQ